MSINVVSNMQSSTCAERRVRITMRRTRKKLRVQQLKQDLPLSNDVVDGKKRRDVLVGLGTSIGFGIFPSVAQPAHAFKTDRQLVPLEYGIMDGLFDRLVGKTKFPLMLRLAFHDAFTFSTADNSGGPNGSIQFELDRPENFGLKRGWKLIGEVQKSVEGTPLAFLLSPADIIALAGAYSVKATGGPAIEVKIGRVAAQEADPEGRIPGEDFNVEQIKQYFQRAGFTTQEMVALSGAHTIGGKGFGNPSKFDNTYYKTLIQKPWDDPKNEMGKMIGIPTDRLIATDEECLTHINTYANDQKAFFTDFRDAYLKMVNLGVTEFPQ